MANPWFVAINSGSDSTFSGADFSGAPSGYQVFQAGSAADAASLATAAKTGDSVSLHHIIWTNVNGPYSTQAAAQAGQAKAQAASPAPGLAKQLGIPNPAAPFADVAHALSAVYGALTNVYMWVSLGWIIGGAVLMYVSLKLWLGDALPGLPKIVPVPL